MNSADLKVLSGTVGIRLEEKGELKTMTEFNAVAARFAATERKVRLLVKYTGIYPEDEPIISTGVSFHVALRNHSIFCTDETLRFHDVITNGGNAYNRTTGQFTAPQPAKYLFNVTIRADIGQQVTVQMNCNNEMLGRLTSGHGSVDKPTSSLTVAVELNQGDVVEVVHMGDTSGEYYGNGYTTFTGLLFD